MLNSLEYLLPLCSVYRTVIISVDKMDKFTVLKLARDIFIYFFFLFLIDQRLLANWLCEKNEIIIKKICWWCNVHRSPQAQVCCQAGDDFSMNSKDNW